jgi:hypothetical protein
MDEVGLDISRQTPKNLDQFQRERVSFPVTRSATAKLSAPVRFSPAQFGGCNGRLKTQLPREAATNAAR